jgi:hypothetical protein
MTDLFRYKIGKLTAQRDGAEAAGEYGEALRLTDEILQVIARQKKMLSIGK